MKGYVVVETELQETEVFLGFVNKVLGAIDAHGGRFLVRTSDVEPVEGDWSPKRLVVMEFDSVDAAKGFVNATYADPEEVARRTWTSRVLIAGGYESAG